MAADYVVLSQNRDVQVLSATEVLDVERVGIRTRPTGVTAEYPIPYDVWLAQQGGPILTALATGIEQMISQGFAKTGAYVNDLDANGLLVDYIEFVIEWVDPNKIRPPMTTTARVPEEWFVAAVDPFAFGLIADAEAILTAAYDALAAQANQ